MRRIFPYLAMLVFGLAAHACAADPEPATFKAAAPELIERPEEEWINSKPLKLADLKGQVVVFHFWTFGCINCQRNLPHYKAWHEKFSMKGVTLLGVHTPETKAEKDPKNVRAAIEKEGIKYPVVLDMDIKTWQQWDNRWWPSTYLIDKQGFVRYRWDGELNWQKLPGEKVMRKKIELLLAEPDPKNDSNAATGTSSKKKAAARKKSATVRTKK